MSIVQRCTTQVSQHDCYIFSAVSVHARRGPNAGGRPNGQPTGLPLQHRMHTDIMLNCLGHVHDATGSDLTTFTKSGPRPDPKVIAHRSPATRGEMLVMTKASALDACSLADESIKCHPQTSCKCKERLTA